MCSKVGIVAILAAMLLAGDVQAQGPCAIFRSWNT